MSFLLSEMNFNFSNAFMREKTRENCKKYWNGKNLSYANNNSQPLYEEIVKRQWYASFPGTQDILQWINKKKINMK